MADRFPLILNTSTNQIQEIPSGDNLDLTGVGINNVGVITSGNVTIGAATTDLVVTGDARITGILTVGTSSLKLDGPNNLVNVGTALTLGHTQGVQFHTQNLHSAGFEVNQINVSGASTIGGNLDANGDLDVDGHTNLDNVSVAGVSTFAGNADFSAGIDVTGNLIASGNLTANNGTVTVSGTAPKIIFTETNDNPDYKLEANGGNIAFVDTTNSVTRLSISSGGINVTGNGTFSGNVSVGGVLTYEDVTNVDSVGIVTAREGVFLPDLKQLKIGNTAAAPDLYLWHNSSTGNSNISNKTGDLFIQGNNGSGTVVNQIAVKSNAAVELNYQGSKKFETTSYGNLSAGQVRVNSSNTASVAFSVGDVNTGFYNSGSHAIGYAAQGTQMWNIDSAGNLRLNDSVKAYFGTSNDLQIYHDGSNSRISDNGAGNLILDGNEVIVQSNDNSETQARFISNGAVELYHNNTKRFETTSTGVQAVRYSFDTDNYITCNTSANTMEIVTNSTDIGEFSPSGLMLRDSMQLRLGTGNDLRLYHDQANTINYINSQNGNLRIQQGGTTLFQMTGSQVKLYHSGTEKLNTSANTVNIVNGGLSVNRSNAAHAGAIYFSGTDTNHMLWQDHWDNPSGTRQNSGTFDGIKWNCYDGLQLFRGNEAATIAKFLGGNNGCELYFNNTKRFETTSSGVAITGMADATGNSARFRTIESGGATVEIRSGGSEGYVGTSSNHKVSLITNSTRRWEISGAGHFIPYANNTYDIGSSSYRVRNVYTHDLNLSNEGSKNDVDGTWGNYTIQEGESDLFLINKRNGKKYKFNLTEVS